MSNARTLQPPAWYKGSYEEYVSELRRRASKGGKSPNAYRHFKHGNNASEAAKKRFGKK